MDDINYNFGNDGEQHHRQLYHRRVLSSGETQFTTIQQDANKAGKSQLLYSKTNLKRPPMGRNVYHKKPETAGNHGKKSRNRDRVESPKNSFGVKDEQLKDYVI